MKKLRGVMLGVLAASMMTFPAFAHGHHAAKAQPSCPGGEYCIGTEEAPCEHMMYDEVCGGYRLRAHCEEHVAQECHSAVEHHDGHGYGCRR